MVKVKGPRPAGMPPGASRAGGFGFTLIELLVVLAIIATLLTIAAPRYLGQLEAAREAVLRDNLRTTRRAIDAFHADQGRYPKTLEEMVERRYLRSPPTDPITGRNDDWRLRHADAAEGGGIRDLHSSAPGQAADGSAYADW